MTASTLAYLAEAARRGALGHTLSCSCDLCCPRSLTTTPEEHEMTDTHEPLIAGSPRSLAEVVECIKQTGGAVEIQGVRIEPCDERGETATTRNLSEVMELLSQMEGKYIQAREWAAWFAAERDYWRDEARAARAAAINLHADKNVLKGQLRAARRLGTETGTRPAAAPQGDLIGFVPATFLPADEQNPLPRLAAYHSTAYGTADEARAKLDELGPGYGLWRVIELREASSDSAPRPAPAGYVVVTRNSEGGAHRSATVWDSLEQANTAEGIASGYADGTGCTAAVYELREVQQ